ncbi:beta-N-acetylhexosaminidase [Paenibacillus sabinae]|uniref:Glycoside hydrolase family protein n=1 Tax=Paenibacillus sabinae T27 TaxID=1268072 RepID=X4ZC71_9BACL|nr:beta-N-acetylhexosaminidase [Paenibacillus sabinae]AHV95122.1 glycoside hydrolase family protein [Paenibacillus sabinae T27]
MKFWFEGDISPLLPGIGILAGELGFQLEEDGIPVLVGISGEGIEVGCEDGRAYIRYGRTHQFFRGLGLLVQHVRKGAAFHIRERQQFDLVGPMFDLSRNAVLTTDSFKAMLNKMALMGLNTVMLYMEDTYEIEGEPYFGYMRGRYSQQELREIDDYAAQFGIEAFPSIQTLAHLEEFLKWEPVSHYRDTKGALLVSEERTIKLVERMVESASAPFRSRKIHIGMDEAEELGRGKYLDRNGYSSRFDIMISHLEKVLDIARGRGLEPMMWSDMFLKLASASGGEYYDEETSIPEEMRCSIPKDVDMVYWDYVHTETEDYERLIEKHRSLGSKLAFAGAVWIFNTFGVNYGLSLKASDTALQVCKKEGIGEVYATMWGDDGNEGNPFAALLGLQLYAEHAYSPERPEWEHLAERVKFCTGIEADSYLLMKDLDETPGAEPDNRVQSNPSKFLLYQDVLLGLFDYQIDGLELSAHYEALQRSLSERSAADPAAAGMLEVPEKLCAVLKRKSLLGVELKRAYDAGDKAALAEAAVRELPEIAQAVRELRSAHRTAWYRMFKPFGWEVLDIRYGGLVNRLDSAAMRLLDYTEGRIARIEELEQERLPYSSANRFNHRGAGWCSYYYRMASPNVFFHVLNPF